VSSAIFRNTGKENVMDKDMFERLFRTALQVVGAIVATRYVGEDRKSVV
jgi:hypothetical protein